MHPTEHGTANLAAAPGQLGLVERIEALTLYRDEWPFVYEWRPVPNRDTMAELARLYADNSEGRWTIEDAYIHMENELGIYLPR